MKNKKGFTLIEVILVMVVLGICLPPLSLLVVNVVRQNVFSQAQATAVALAEGEVERVTNMRFSAVDGVTSTQFSAPFAAYSYNVNVDYVNSGALETPVAGPTNYKRVQVVVSNAISGNVTLTTVMTNY